MKFRFAGLLFLFSISSSTAEFTISVNFFEILNPNEVIEGALPSVREVGPYVYNEERSMVDKETDGDNLSFGEYKRYSFNSEKSCDGCTENDQVRILNLPLIGVVQECLNQGSLIGGVLCGLVEGAINGEFQDELFFQHSVKDLLFDGVSTGIVEFLMTNALTQNRLPPQIQENGFALFNGKNDTTDNGWFTLNTSPESYGYLEWGPKKEDKHSSLAFTKWWPHADVSGEVDQSSCNMLTGTDGSKFKTEIVEDDLLWHFSHDICRSIFFGFSHRDPEDMERFVFTTPVDSLHVNRTRNFCFCGSLKPSCAQATPDPEVLDLSACDLGQCHDGLIDVRECYQSPIVLSQPHFYLAEHQLANFEGMSPPDKDSDESRVEVDSLTGDVYRTENKLQINMPIVKHPKVTILENVPEILFPIMWVNNEYHRS